MTNPNPSIDDQVLDIIGQVSRIPKSAIRLENDLRIDLQLDSVCFMELVSMLCEEFDIDVDIEEAMEIRDVRGAIDTVHRYVNAR